MYRCLSVPFLNFFLVVVFDVVKIFCVIGQCASWWWVYLRCEEDGSDVGYEIGSVGMDRTGDRDRGATHKKDTSFPCTSGPETLPVELERFLVHDLGIINPWLVQHILYPHQRLVTPPPPPLLICYEWQVIFLQYLLIMWHSLVKGQFLPYCRLMMVNCEL